MKKDISIYNGGCGILSIYWLAQINQWKNPAKSSASPNGPIYIFPEGSQAIFKHNIQTQYNM